MIYDGLELRQTALDSSMWPLFFCQRLILSWACLQGGRVLKTQLSRDSGGPALNWHYRFCHILSQRKWQNQSRFKGKKKKKIPSIQGERCKAIFNTIYGCREGKNWDPFHQQFITTWTVIAVKRFSLKPTCWTHFAIYYH